MKSSCRSTVMLAVVFAGLFAMSDAYGTGAPARACAGAQPIHSPNVQPLDPANNPYSFDLTVSEYVPGENLEVTISSSSGSVNGFFLQGRRVDTGAAVGTFLDPLPSVTKVLQCTNARDSVTHSSPYGKTGLTFTWQAPGAGMGEIQFVGAVAIDHDNFYGGMMSSTLQEGGAMTTSGMNANTTDSAPTNTTGMTGEGETTMSMMMTESDHETTTRGSATMMSSGIGFLILALIVGMRQLFQ